MEDVAVALDVHVLRDGHGPGPRDAAQVVAPEVDEHHVLGALLRVALELLGEDLRPRRRGATGAGAGNRVGRQLVAIDLEEELRAGPDDLERGHPDEEQVRARVDAAQARYSPMPSSGCPVAGSVGRSNDWRRASTTWIASPAAIASFAVSTAWTYSSWPRLVWLAGQRARRGRRRSAAMPRRPRAAVRPVSAAPTAAPSARAPRRSPPRRSGSGPRGRAPRCAATRSPTACGSGGRRRGRDRSR